MAKNRKKRGCLGFVIGMILYATVFLGLTGWGLSHFWDFIEAYELSRPGNTIDAYMAQLTPEYIAGRCGELIAQIDHNIQSEEVCRTVIADAVSEKITYAKKTSDCTDTKNVYVLRCGGRVIGQVELEPRSEEAYGFTPWAVTSDSFDLSFLLTQTVSATAPHDYPVYVNGALLDDRYIVETGMQYTALEEFIGEYELPYMVSYTAGPCLGSISLQITDPAGNPVTIGEGTDMNAFLDNCTESELSELDSFSREFVRLYVNFLTSRASNRYENYDSLTPYLVPGSDLAKRVKNALAGLEYGASRSDTIVSLTVNRNISLGNDRYLCDVTYVVDTAGYLQMIRTTNNAKIIVVKTEEGLKAETLINY